GVFSVGGSFVWWFFRDLKAYVRVVFGILALLSIYHDFWISVAAMAGIVVVMIYFKKSVHDDSSSEDLDGASA
ncbi:MAG: C4-dicarboxylate ABC transporter permease, partial [Synergistaceae bacterium]|nr:C4-dicarboxylate ABC transporter permease [Synergistaceae bacterium]